MGDASLAYDRHFVLGGKVALHQQMGGAHKAGLDAVMLAASVQEDSTQKRIVDLGAGVGTCLLYTSPSPRDRTRSRMPSSA